MNIRKMTGTRITSASIETGTEPPAQTKKMSKIGPVTSGKDSEKPTAGTFSPDVESATEKKKEGAGD